jgi:hypothetical protein
MMEALFNAANSFYCCTFPTGGVRGKSISDGQKGKRMLRNVALSIPEYMQIHLQRLLPSTQPFTFFIHPIPFTPGALLVGVLGSGRDKGHLDSYMYIGHCMTTGL